MLKVSASRVLYTVLRLLHVILSLEIAIVTICSSATGAVMQSGQYHRKTHFIWLFYGNIVRKSLFLRLP